jgi:hypothetical protein
MFLKDRSDAKKQDDMSLLDILRKEEVERQRSVKKSQKDIT